MELAYGVWGMLLGLALFLFPGMAWSWAFAPGLPRLARVALGLVLAFTVAPALMFALNLMFDVPIRLDTIAFVSLALGLVGVARMVAQPLLARVST